MRFLRKKFDYFCFGLIFRFIKIHLTRVRRIQQWCFSSSLKGKIIIIRANRQNSRWINSSNSRYLKSKLSCIGTWKEASVGLETERPSKRIWNWVNCNSFKSCLARGRISFSVVRSWVTVRLWFRWLKSLNLIFSVSVRPVKWALSIRWTSLVATW